MVAIFIVFTIFDKNNWFKFEVHQMAIIPRQLQIKKTRQMASQPRPLMPAEE